MENTEPKKIIKKTIRNDEETRKAYYSNYHKNSTYEVCDICFKKYRKSKGIMRHKQTKRHQEFENLKKLNLLL